MAPPYVPAPIYNGVAGNTTLLTSLGAFPISQLVDQRPVVWNGVAWEQVLVQSAGTNQPLYQVTLQDGRSLQCSANYLWYVQGEYGTSYKAVPTSALTPGSTIVWRTQLPITANYVAGAFPTVASVALVGQSGNLYYLSSSTDLAVLNGILAGAGAQAEGLPHAIPSPTPTPSPTPAPTPFPWVPPSPSPVPNPSALSFTYAPINGNPLALSFTAYLNDPNAQVVSWRWMLGDGAVGTTRNVTHIYAMATTYTVRLLATYVDGTVAVAEGVVNTRSTAPAPSPTPAGYVEPVAPTHSEAFYLGKLQNGISVNINPIDTSTNVDYVADPYFNFELPAGATNLSVRLTADSAGSFANAQGWLMVRRASRPSSNDGDMAVYGLTAETPDANNVYAVALSGTSPAPSPSAVVLNSGEWFVSLDLLSPPISGMSIVAAWIDPASAPPVQTVVNGNNGTLVDGADFLFTIPAAAVANQTPSNVYWSINVPPNYVLNVTVDDNAQGGLATAVGQGSTALIFSVGGPYGGSGSTSQGIDLSGVPLTLSYVNTTLNPVTIYVNLASYEGSSIANVRLLSALEPASYTALHASPSPTPTPTPSPSPSGTWLDVTTILGTDAGISLTSAVQDWVTDPNLTYSSTEPVYLADATTFWNATENSPTAIANAVPASSGPMQIYARIANKNYGSSVTSSANGVGEILGAVYGYQPFSYAISPNFPSDILQPYTSTGQLSIQSFPMVVYFREVVILAFSNGNVDLPNSKSFVELAVLFDPNTSASAPGALYMQLQDANSNTLAAVTSTEQVVIWSKNSYKLIVYRADMVFGSPTMTTWNQITTNGAVTTAGLVDYLQLFGAAMNASTPLYLKANAAA